VLARAPSPINHQPILERFQLILYQHRTSRPNHCRLRWSQHAALSSLRAGFNGWPAKTTLLFHSASDSITQSGHRLPKPFSPPTKPNSHWATPNITELFGVRDRASRNVLQHPAAGRRGTGWLRRVTSTRSERTVMIVGKGKKYRIHPIGKNERCHGITVTSDPLRGANSAASTNRRCSDTKANDSPRQPHNTSSYIDDSGSGKRRFLAICSSYDGHTDARTREPTSVNPSDCWARQAPRQRNYTQVSIGKLRQSTELTHPADHEREEPDPTTESTGDDSDTDA